MRNEKISRLFSSLYLASASLSLGTKQEGGQKSINDCIVCATGSFMNSSSLTDRVCTPCERGYTTTNSTSNSTANISDVEHHDSSDDCKFAAEGFWLTEPTDAFPKGELIECSNKGERCKGYNECKKGYQDYLCGVCADNFFTETNGECKECPEDKISFIPHICVLSSFAGLALIVALNLGGLQTKLLAYVSERTPKSLLMTFSIFKSRIKSIQSKVKVAFSFFQVVMLMGRVYSIEYPPEYVEFERTWFDWLGLTLINNIEVSERRDEI